MKKFIVLFSIFFIVVLGGLIRKPNYILLPWIDNVAIEEYREYCEYTFNPTTMENMVPTGDEKYACFTDCLLRKMGYFTRPSEHINFIFNRSKLLSSGLPLDQVNDLLTKCDFYAHNVCEKDSKLLMKCMTANQFIITTQ